MGLLHGFLCGLAGRRESFSLSLNCVLKPKCFPTSNRVNGEPLVLFKFAVCTYLFNRTFVQIQRNVGVHWCSPQHAWASSKDILWGRPWPWNKGRNACACSVWGWKTSPMTLNWFNPVVHGTERWRPTRCSHVEKLIQAVAFGPEYHEYEGNTTRTRSEPCHDGMQATRRAGTAWKLTGHPAVHARWGRKRVDG